MCAITQTKKRKKNQFPPSLKRYFENAYLCISRSILLRGWTSYCSCKYHACSCCFFSKINTKKRKNLQCYRSCIDGSSLVHEETFFINIYSILSGLFFSAKQNSTSAIITCLCLLEKYVFLFSDMPESVRCIIRCLSLFQIPKDIPGIIACYSFVFVV